jgi:hypothetical protein
MVMQAKLSVDATRHFTFELLAAALSKDEWDLARDLIRFLDVNCRHSTIDRLLQLTLTCLGNERRTTA